jgi:hypothetical protein
MTKACKETITFVRPTLVDVFMKSSLVSMLPSHPTAEKLPDCAAPKANSEKVYTKARSACIVVCSET